MLWYVPVAVTSIFVIIYDVCPLQEGKAGETILHRAVQANHTKLVSLLLEFRQTDVNCQRYDGKTPYQLAYLLNLQRMQDLLLRYNAVAMAIVESDEDVMDTSSESVAAVNTRSETRKVGHSNHSTPSRASKPSLSFAPVSG